MTPPTLTEICQQADTAARLPLSEIIEDQWLQVRAVHEPTAKRYAAMLTDDKRGLDPLTVYLVDGDHLLVDGWHRLAAHRLAGLDVARVNIIAGSKREAWLAAISANAKHGRALTQKEKRAAVQRLLEDDELRLESNRALARLVGCSHTLVAELRAPYEAAAAEQRADGQGVAGVHLREAPAHVANDKDRRRWVILDLLEQHRHYLGDDEHGLSIEDLARVTGHEPASLGKVLRAMSTHSLVEDYGEGDQSFGWQITAEGREFLRLAAQAGLDQGAAAAGRARDRAVQAATPPSLADQIRAWTDDQVGMAAARLAEYLVAAPWTFAQLADLGQDYLLPDAPACEIVAYEVLADRIDDWLFDRGYVQRQAGDAEPDDRSDVTWELTEAGRTWAENAAQLLADQEGEAEPQPSGPASPAVTPPRAPADAVANTHPVQPQAQRQPPADEPAGKRQPSGFPLRCALADCIEDRGAAAPLPSRTAMALAVVIGLEGSSADYEAVLHRESVFVDVVREHLVEHLRAAFASMNGLPTVNDLAALFGIDWHDVIARAEQLERATA